MKSSNLKESKVLNSIKEFSSMSLIGNTPEVALHTLEDGDTFFLDGYLVIFNIKTNIQANNIKKVSYDESSLIIELKNGNELLLCTKAGDRFLLDYESIEEDLKENFEGISLSHEECLDESTIIELIQKCSNTIAMDYLPYIDFDEIENSDAYFNEDGNFVIYDVETELKKEDFLAIRWKDNEDFTRDPYIAFYLTNNRYLELRCIPGDMTTANVDKFVNELINNYNGVIISNH